MQKEIVVTKHSPSVREIQFATPNLSNTRITSGKSSSSRPLISYRNIVAAFDFLSKHGDVEPFIESAWPHLLSHFGKQVNIVLEVLVYPEGGPNLIGWIQSQSTDLDDAMNKYFSFEDNWYLDNLNRVTTKFHFNIES